MSHAALFCSNAIADDQATLFLRAPIKLLMNITNANRLLKVHTRKIAAFGPQLSTLARRMAHMINNARVNTTTMCEITFGDLAQKKPSAAKQCQKPQGSGQWANVRRRVYSPKNSHTILK